MKDNLKDILSNLNSEIDQETLLLYLQGKLAPEKQHELEKQLMENEFTADAFEGLSKFKDKHKIALLVDTLNADLKKKTKTIMHARKKRPIQFDGWLLIAVAIMLLLIIISYFIIHNLLNN